MKDKLKKAKNKLSKTSKSSKISKSSKSSKSDNSSKSSKISKSSKSSKISKSSNSSKSDNSSKTSKSGTLKDNDISEKSYILDQDNKVNLDKFGSQKNIKKLDPIKIIYKYKNDQRKIQHLIYIYVGELGKKYKNIFKKIEKLNLYNTLLILNTGEIELLKEGFGELWIDKFFNTYHISHTINEIETNTKLKNELIRKYDDMWINKIIEEFKNNILYKKINYSYSEIIKNDYINKMGKKLKTIHRDEFLDINIKEKETTENILYNKKGGEYEEKNINNTEIDNFDENEINNDYFSEYDDDYNERIIEDIDNITELYEDIDLDKDIKKTDKLISKVLNNNQEINKKDRLIKFLTLKDDYYDNENLINVFLKIFVYENYIFKDDTIKTIKNKISTSLLNNTKFGDNNYLIPSRLYLWSEYLLNSKIEKIMLGHVWTKNNDIIDINIEPLKIYNYEIPEGNILSLVNIFKNNTKIHYEDIDDDILYDYENFIMNNEIYMIDIYNEIGLNYSGSVEKKKNITDSLIKIYFPKIKSDEINDIFDYLSRDIHKDTLKESKRIKDIFENIYNNVILEKSITDLIEKTKIEKINEYSSIYKEKNFIIQSKMFIFLKIYNEQLEIENKININKINNITGEYGNIIIPTLDLRRIFNDFTSDELYPFIQYNVQGSEIVIKYYENYINDVAKRTQENIDMMKRWFETSPNGISFKIKINETKFMTVVLNEIGKINYTIIWSEDDRSTIDDLYNTYEYIINLVIKINESLENHPNKVSIKIPERWEFKFIFLNSNQKFIIPESNLINHNDLSDFCRLFFPYVAMIIEPKKRLSKYGEKVEGSSKYGTYLQYKRISKYENKNKMEQRIISFFRLKNYDENALINDLVKLFGITNEQARDEINNVRIKKSKLLKNIKKIDEIPKYKHSGIRIDIQGKSPDKYKIKIAGARNNEQLDRILNFMNILIYLYYETYITKNTKDIKEKLIQLTNIAKRGSLVNEVIQEYKNKSDLKLMKEIDNKRLGFTPNEGHSQYSRLCQNSGEKTRKRPQLITEKDIGKLLKDGYKLNKDTGVYEKKIITKKDGTIVLKTLKINSYDDESNINNTLYYTCDPKNNGEHMYIGFLPRSNNPFGECMPCCYKKNPFETKKKEKLDFYKKCLSSEKDKEEKNINETTELEEITKIQIGDILYILQDTNKIYEGRIGYLPKIMEYFINIQINNEIKIKNLYLTLTGENGYYFKYGINQDNYSFIKSLSSILDMTTIDIKKHIVEFFKKDIDELYYTVLNDGDIKYKYKIGDFIKLIMEDEYLDFYYLKDIIKIKGLFTEKGIYPIILKKRSVIINDKIKEDFYFELDETITNDFIYNIEKIKKMDVLLLLKDGKYYYPIINITKINEKTKDIIIKKFIDNKKLLGNIIDFLTLTVEDVKREKLYTNKTAKEVFMILNDIVLKNKLDEFLILFQVIDNRFKCRYLILKNNLIIPIIPSGIIDDIPIICLGMNNVEGCFLKKNYLTYEKTYELLEKLYVLSVYMINIKPIGVYYDKEEKNNINIIGIITSNNDMIPVKNIFLDKSELDKKKIIYKNIPLEYEIDLKISNYNKDTITVIDNRIKKVNMQKYIRENYQLFRFEFSNLINSNMFKDKYNKLIEIINKKDIKKIQDFVKELCIFKIDEDENMIGNRFITFIEEIPNIDNYKINNQRYLCEKLSEDKCSNNIHCKYHNGKCLFAITDYKLLEYIKKISFELYENSISAMELLNKMTYYVSDIVKYDDFTEKKGQKIIKTTNANVLNILQDIFGKKKVPIIGKRNKNKSYEQSILEMKINNPLKDIKKAFIQNILPFNYSVMRAYVNGYYWKKHELYNNELKNLGYYGDFQNELVNLFNSMIIDWLNISKNIDILLELDNENKELLKNSLILDGNVKKAIDKYIISLVNNNIEKNLGFLELFIINNIHKIPICISINGNIKYYINNIIRKETNEKYLNKYNICINFEQLMKDNYPENVEIIYYK